MATLAEEVHPQAADDPEDRDQHDLLADPLNMLFTARVVGRTRAADCGAKQLASRLALKLPAAEAVVSG